MRRYIAFLMPVLLCFACASVTYLPTNEATRYAPTRSVEVYWEKPERPHIVIGKLSVFSDDLGERSVFERVKKEAMAVGADAVVITESSHQSNAGMPGWAAFTNRTRMEAFAIRFE